MQWLLRNFGKKLTATIAAVVVTLANSWFGWGITEDQVVKILEMVMVYVGGQSIADGLSGGKTSSLASAKDE